jgi:hypothetical protein
MSGGLVLHPPDEKAPDPHGSGADSGQHRFGLSKTQTTAKAEEPRRTDAREPPPPHPLEEPDSDAVRDALWNAADDRRAEIGWAIASASGFCEATLPLVRTREIPILRANIADAITALTKADGIACHIDALERAARL